MRDIFNTYIGKPELLFLLVWDLNDFKKSFKTNTPVISMLYTKMIVK